MPLAGVSVKATGTRVTVQTDNAGNFAIAFPEKSLFLEFTFIGYNKKRSTHRVFNDTQCTA
ncbi:carboxypeptidase-like regulatory domain-containing protein [Paraflavitalea speifideaquila]|uniref:carboxypeptidase-like regulatory domain-containing protein n=1 Tax=Paraflavitalea speifideaquila TaxID=3076558 RepID=UPI003312FBEE